MAKTCINEPSDAKASIINISTTRLQIIISSSFRMCIAMFLHLQAIKEISHVSHLFSHRDVHSSCPRTKSHEVCEFALVADILAYLGR